MVHTIDAGTDAAMIVCFDPGVLPEVKRVTPEMLWELADHGRLWVVNTGADGDYRVKVFVDEPVSGPVAGYLDDPVVVERFPVPTGVVWICGAEYARREPKANTLGLAVRVPAGTYHFTAWRVKASHWQDLEAAELPVWWQRVSRVLNALSGLWVAAFTCTVTVIVAMTQGSIANSRGYAFGVGTALLWVLAIGSSLALARLRRPVARRYEEESASAVVVLRRQI